ncbi:homeobox protein CDX-1-like [Brachionichthys hirsutus]|uniref:homeobox protein CDX-1-like n=1 Tax=Brachionichthys hirsutus TaxID=412623 RepID=UPI0036044B94
MYNSPSARYPAQTVSLSAQCMTPMYDFSGYQYFPGLGDPSTTAWNPVYSPREDYHYGSSPGTEQISFFSSSELSNTPTAAGGGSFTPYSFNSGQDLLFSRRRPCESIRPTTSGGKTRTKDKYRVVYSDTQRMELEREFQYNRYITMRRKTELSVELGLSERQVKIWFQNRRAKERKESRRKLQHSQQASTTTPTSPVHGGPADTQAAASPNSNVLLNAVSEEY